MAVVLPITTAIGALRSPADLSLRRHIPICRMPRPETYSNRALADNQRMRIRIEALDLPGRSCSPSHGQLGGYHNIHVGVQSRNKRDELLGLVPGDVPAATWTLECAQAPSRAGIVDLRGPYIQGPPGGRFIYLSWGTVDDAGEFTMFRRAKLWLDAIPPAVLDSAVERGELVGRLGLTDCTGNPLCASVRPPLIEWST